MELNLSTCYSVFEKHYSRVADSLGVKASFRDDIASYVTHRAMILFKLDLLLIEHRNKIDPDRFFLFGKNALYHYLFSKKGISLSEAKKICLHDTLIVLAEDVSAFQVPKDVISHLRKEFNFSAPDFKLVQDEKRKFQDSEWDFEPADRRLN
ncbi:hypothetical protein AAIC16_000406 [Serratia marcescens]